MAKELKVVEYDKSYAKTWDYFVLNESVNGTFLQTRRFLSYHREGKFHDCSLLFMNGTTIVAVLPAHSGMIEETKCFLSHQGSTFGGIVIGRRFCNISYLEMIFACFDEYLKNREYEHVTLKPTSQIFQTQDSSLIDYFLFLHGYECSMELGYYVDYSDYADEVIANYSASRRRDYRYSLKNEFLFKRLITEKEIEEFYWVLCDNYRKFNKEPIHSLKELLELKFERIPDNVDFYGVYLNEKMVAGAMIFLFSNEIAHTQYLAVKQNCTEIFANEFLYTNLINVFKEKKYRYLSFGTSTLEGGKVLNRSLALYKESFGMREYINYRYHKQTKR